MTEFRDNLRSLRRRLEENKERAITHAAAFAHNQEMYPTLQHPLGAREPRWDGSKAQATLKLDMQEGLDKDFGPKDLHRSFAEYQKFSLGKFTKHIHQNRRAEKTSSYWKNKQAGRKKKKRQPVIKPTRPLSASEFYASRLAGGSSDEDD